MKNRLTNLMVLFSIIFLFLGVQVTSAYEPVVGGNKNVSTNFPTRFNNSGNQLLGTSTAKVTGTDQVSDITFTNPYDNSSLHVYAGTFAGTINGVSASFYCIDIQHHIKWDSPSDPNPYTDAGFTPSEVTYILNNYYPYKSVPSGADVKKEAAALQVAIWHFMDGVDANTVNDAVIKARALVIIADAVANAGTTKPVETLQILPPNQNNLVGNAAKFNAAAYDETGAPVNALTINFTASTGSLSTSSLQTDAAGMTTLVSLAMGNSLTSEITATANAIIPQGTRYFHIAAPDIYQKLVLATPTTVTRIVKGSANWNEGDCDLKGYTTYTQGGWGSKPNSTPGHIREQYFPSAFPNGLVIGGIYKITLTSSSAVQGFIPQGGTADALTQNYNNPTSKITVLAGQLVALTLSVEFDKVGAFGIKSTHLGDLVISSGTLAGKTVNEFLAIANTAIGGGSLGGYTLSQLNDAATAMNENFDNGTVDKGYLACPPVVCKSSIGDFVWHDLNYDGKQDANEPGIQGVQVELVNNSNQVLQTVTTDVNGKYSFTDVVNGTYTVRIAASNFVSGGLFFNTDQTKWYASKKDQGDDTKDSDGDLTTHSASVTVNCSNNITIDFGFYKTCISMEKSVAPTTAKPGDVVTYTFTVSNCGDVAHAGGADLFDALLNPSGNHSIKHFDLINPGQTQTYTQTYTVTENNCGQLVNTATIEGHPSNGSAYVTFQSSATLTVNCKSSLGDKVWNDVNKNGIQDNNETGVGGVTVKLLDCNGTVLKTTTTDNNGLYLFSDLTAGSYKVQVVLPNGYAFTLKDVGNDALDSDVELTDGTTTCITLPIATNDLTWDAGIYVLPAPKGSLGDRLWEDKNKNGVQDEGELGVPGVLVSLFNCNNELLAEATTDNNGLYLFSDLVSGDYKIQFVLPTGYLFTQKDAGINDAIDSDVDINTGMTVCTNLEAGENDLTWDAGIYKKETGCVTNWSAFFTVVGAQNNSMAVCWLNSQAASVTGHVDLTPNPSSARLQLAWNIVQPNDGSVDNSTHYINQDITGSTDFTINGIWPGVRCTDQIVEIHFGVNVLDCNGNVIHNGEGFDYYWNPNVCSAPACDNADLELTKTVSDENPKNGDNITYTITVINKGAKDADNVEVKDVLPSGLDYISSSSTNGSYDNTTGKWIVGSLANGASAVLSITVKVNVNQMNNSNFDLGLAKGYNVFVLYDINQPSSDTEGKMAVGRSAELGCYSVGDKLTNSNGAEDVLIVGENLTYHSGAVYSGNVVYGSSSNLPIYLVSINNGDVHQGNPIDFAAARTYLTNLSTQLSGYTVNGTTKFEWGGLFLKGTDPFLNVFKVSGAELSSANNFEIDVPNGSVVLVNIDGVDVSWTGGLVIFGTEKSNVLYNFYNASTLRIQGIDVRGSILAPFAAVNFVSGVQNGQMIAKSITGQGQFNNTQFIGNIPVDHITNVAEVSASSKYDPDSTPNNGVESEDDFGKAVVHITFDNNGPVGNSDQNNWKSMNNFNSNSVVSTLASDAEGNLFAGVVDGSILSSKDGGNTWNKVNNISTKSIWSIANNGNELLAGTETGLYRSLDKGNTWVSAGLSMQDVRTVTSDNEGSLFASVWGAGVYSSNDNGKTWTSINDGLTNLSVQSLLINSNSDLYASTFGSGVVKFNKANSKWNELTIGYDYVWSLTKDSKGVLYAGTYGNGLYRSVDNGENWIKVNSSLTAKYIYSMTVDGNDNIYASSVANGVFVSKDGGENWKSIGMDGYGISSMIVNPISNDLFVGTKSGKVFKSVNGTTSVDKNNELPSEFKLSQNYPNPFNPSTTIEFSIAMRGQVTLSIYNMLGQTVRTLIDQELEQGNYNVSVNASELASGVYIYKLTSPSVSISKKMILQK
ncbi:MAG: choice-of-anchor A family protein [Ignavibacteriales bacterium]|nr:choice-of-anchor A family protein [Ignavibacteriales bacterium]